MMMMRGWVRRRIMREAKENEKKEREAADQSR